MAVLPLTNKTITDSSNTVYANAIKSATTNVIVSSATAPTSGQVLTATSSSNATWQTPATLSTPVTIANGGTNSTTALSGSSIMVSNGSSILQGQAGTTSTVLHGNASGAPTYGKVALASDVSGVLPVISGGTGQTEAFLSGELLIGNSVGNTLTKATLTSGTGINIVNGTGSITVNATNNGTVTSVTAGNGLSGGIITGSGTIGISAPVSIANGGNNSATALSGSSIMVSNGTSIVQGQAGTTTTVLHGNASGAPTYGKVALASDCSGVLPVISGGTGQTEAFLSGELLIGNSVGNTLTKSTLTGTANQVNVTNGAGSITLSTPQNIATTSTPTFASETLTATTNQLILGTTRTATINAVQPATTSRVYTIPDAGANDTLQ